MAPFLLGLLPHYERIRSAYESAFPGSALRLAFTSRLMIKRLQEKEGITVASPQAALEELHSSGCMNAVVQSLQIVPGEEFHQLVSLVQRQGFESQKAMPAFERLEIGLPLLSSLMDCRRVSRVLPVSWNGSGWGGGDNPQSLQDRDPEKEAVLLVGHGTGHPADAFIL